MTRPAHIDEAIRLTVRRTATASALRGAGQGVVIGLGAAGLGALILRFGLDLPAVQALWAGLAVPVGGVVGGALGVTRLSRDEAAAWLDDRWNCGGLLMLAAEGWGDRPMSVRAPRVRWFDRFLGIKLAVLACFLIAALLIPAQAGPAAPPPGFNLEPVVDRLAEEVELLEEIEAIDAEEAKRLEEELQSVEELARGDDPSGTWEALDHARQQLDRLAEQAGDELADLAAMAALAEQLGAEIGEALDESGGELSPEQAEALRQAVEQMNDGSLPKSLSEAMAKLAQSLSEQGDQQRKAAQGVCDAAGACSASAMAGLGRLAGGNMIDPSKLAQARAGQLAAQLALSELMQSYNAGECDILSMLASMESMCSGGIGRGPGAAMLTWRDQASSIDASFDPVAVDPGALDPQKSVFISDAAALPDGEQAGASSTGGAIDTSRSAESRSSTPVVLPRHREAVRRYFERAQENQEEPGE